MEYEYKFFFERSVLASATGMAVEGVLSLARADRMAPGWELLSHDITVVGKDLIISVLARREQAQAQTGAA